MTSPRPPVRSRPFVAPGSGRLSTRARRALPYALVFAGFLGLHLGLYHGIWANEYYKDDYQWMADARNVARSPAALLHRHPDNTEIFARQTQRVLFGLTYLWSGLRPAGYAIVGLLLHTLAATLVFALLRRLLEPPVDSRGTFDRNACPLVGALFFAASSNHDAAVLWISAQSTLLAAVLLLGLFLAVIRHETRLGEPRVAACLAGMFLIALFTKITVASFPLILGVFVLGRRGAGKPGRRGGIVLVGILLAMAVAQVLYTRATLGHVHVAEALTAAGADSFRLSRNVPLNLAGAFIGCFLSAPQYARFFPTTLPFWFVSLLLLLLLATCLRFVTRRRAIYFGVAWILITALPTALFDYVQYSEEQITVNRYYYLPIVGASIIVAALLQELLGKMPKGPMVAGLLVVFCGGYVASQVGPLRGKLQYFRGYNAARASMIHWTLDSAHRKAKPGAVIYAVNWRQDDYQIHAVSRLYFEEAGYRLAGQHEYDRFAPSDAGDGVQRWAAKHDDETKQLRFFALPPGRVRD